MPSNEDESEWKAYGFGNHILYKMCDDYPYHNDEEVIEGKLWLIGHSYSASPARGAGKPATGSNGNLLTALAKAIKEDSKFDEEVDKAKSMGRISCETKDIPIALHARLNRLIVDTIKAWRDDNPAGRQVRDRTSFASKYLHFHAPDAFFIYDSVICGKLKDMQKFTGYRRKMKEGDFEAKYARLCKMLLIYAQDKKKPGWTPRSIDKEIYEY